MPKLVFRIWGGREVGALFLLSESLLLSLYIRRFLCSPRSRFVTVRFYVIYWVSDTEQPTHQLDW